MRKPFIFFLWLFLLVFVIASLYISFTAYLYERDAKLLANVSAFFVGVNKGKEKIDIPYPEYGHIIYRVSPKMTFKSSNPLPTDYMSKFTTFQFSFNGSKVYVFAKKVNLRDYLDFVSQNVFYLGLLIMSLALYPLVFYFTLKEFEPKEQVAGKEPGEIPQDLINRLKAIRLSIATNKIIPEESAQEIKQLLDEILESKLTKKE